MTIHQQRAHALHGQYNCAQTVFAAFAPDYGLAQTDALGIAAGFGGGMGDLGDTCGAVTGALMVLGLAHGNRKQGDKEAKAADYERAAKFVAEFEKRVGCCRMCRELTKDFDDKSRFPSEEARIAARRSKCGDYIDAAVALLEEMLG